jgi:drug/metabolite transporter (DMT)-like permease
MTQIAFAFGLVYVIWGSTYLGIRVAVEHMPPFLMGASRYMISGPLMLAWCAATGRRVRISWCEARRLAVVGVLLLTTANVVVGWGELYVPSGLAALVVASVPLWVMLIETLGFGHARPPVRGVLGVALGIAGIVVLLWPKFAAGGALRGNALLGVALLMEASASWALGSVLSRRWKLGLDAMSASGWQMTFAGLVNLACAALLGDFARARWTPSAFAAIGYLVVFGSWIGFSAYVWLLKHVPTSKVATYAYVNPVVAVFLGWLILHEQVDLFVVLGSIVIVAAVVLATTARVGPERRVAAEPEAPCEQGAD